MKFVCLLALSAAAVCAASHVVTPGHDDNATSRSILDNDGTQDRDNRTFVPDFTDDDKDDGDNATIDGITLRLLEKPELESLLDDEDNIVQSELDICVLKTIVDARSGNTVNQGNSTSSKVRKRRFLPFAFAAARILFHGATRALRPTVSGSRITQQYIRKGGYRDAVNHFNALRPNNVKTFSKNGISGRTGTVGNHRVTVRDGSKQGSPTLEIRSPRPGKREFVRKFRYE
ncbi:hypothetical protein BsWGS_10260 [Bradybaena similaris]